MLAHRASCLQVVTVNVPVVLRCWHWAAVGVAVRHRQGEIQQPAVASRLGVIPHISPASYGHTQFEHCNLHKFIQPSPLL